MKLSHDLPRLLFAYFGLKFLHLQFAEDYTAHYRLIFGESNDSYSPSAEAQAVGVTAFRGLNSVVAGLLPAAASQARKEDAALQVWALIHGSVSLRQHAVAELVNMTHWKTRTLRAVEILIDGIAG